MVFAVLIVAAMTFSTLEPIQVLPRSGLAPGYSPMVDDGSAVTSEDARGQVTLYSFAPTDCGERGAAMFETMRQVAERADLRAPGTACDVP